MFYIVNFVIKYKVGLFNLAEEFSNVLKVCKIMGVLCDMFYCYCELVVEGGVDVQINCSCCVFNFKNCIDEVIEQVVVDYVVVFLIYGQYWVSNELCKQGVFIFDSGVCFVWLFYNFENFKR